jgi:hypothetical protein
MSTRNNKQTIRSDRFDPTPWVKKRSVNWNRIYTVAILVVVSAILVIQVSTLWGA